MSDSNETVTPTTKPATKVTAQSKTAAIVVGNLKGTTGAVLLGGVTIAVLALVGLPEYPAVSSFALGAAFTLAPVAALAKQDGSDPDNWYIAATSVAIFLLYHATGIFFPELIHSDRAWMLPAVFVPAVWAVYNFWSSWDVWPIAFLFGGQICGIGATGFYWALVQLNLADSKFAQFGWFVAAWGGFVAWTLLNVYLEEFGGTTHKLGRARATNNAGEGYAIARRGELWAVVANSSNIQAKTVLTPEQFKIVMGFRRRQDFDGLAVWAKEQGLEYDPRWELATYLLLLPNLWQRPWFSVILSWLHVFNLRNLGDIENVNSPEGDPTDIQITVTPLQDVDVERKEVGTGQRSTPLRRLVVSVDELRMIGPFRFMRQWMQWRDRWGTAIDKLAGAVGTELGNLVIGVTSRSIRELAEASLINRGAGFRIETIAFAGAPKLAAAVDAFMVVVRGMFLESTEPVIKEAQGSAEVEAAQRSMTEAEAEAERIAVVEGAHLEAVDRMLRRAGYDDPKREAFMHKVLPLLVLGNMQGATKLMTELGIGTEVAAMVSGVLKGQN